MKNRRINQNDSCPTADAGESGISDSYANNSKMRQTPITASQRSRARWVEKRLSETGIGTLKKEENKEGQTLSEPRQADRKVQGTWFV